MKHVFILSVFAGLFVCVYAQSPESKAVRPVNIVLFIADDLTVTDIGPYGNKIVRTPHLDRFSKQSLVFNKAFAASATCSPSRSAIMTGLMPLRNGAHSNHTAVKQGTRSIVHYLAQLQYRVSIAGKLHIGPEEVFSFERIPNTNVPEPGHEKNPGLNYDLNLAPVDQWLGSKKKKPFMLVVADHSPHVVWPEKPAYDPEKIDIPFNHADTRETRTARARYYTDITKMDDNFGRMMGILDKHGLSENTLVLFIADQGAQWPFGKWTLYDDGIRAPLIVRWPGRVSPGTRSDALVSLVDLVPTIAEVAGAGELPEMDGKSFMAILKGDAELHRPEVFATHTGDGNMNRSPARMLRSQRYKYILNLAPGILFNTHMNKATNHDGGREYWSSWVEKSFRDEHAAALLWRYHNRPAEELYDLEKDPKELHNLVGDGAYDTLLKEYRAKLTAWRQQQGDDATGPEVITEQPKSNQPLAPYVF